MGRPASGVVALGAAALAGAGAALLLQLLGGGALRALLAWRTRQSWLERTLRRTIPITNHMGVRVLAGGDEDDDSGEASVGARGGRLPRDRDLEPLVLAAPWALNRNIHGTVFAGSLQAVAVLAGWGWVEMHARRIGGSLGEAGVVVRRVEMSFKRPVTGDFVARAEPPTAEALHRFHETFNADGKATLALHVTLSLAADVAAAGASTPAPAAFLDGEFTAVHPRVARKRAAQPATSPPGGS